VSTTRWRLTVALLLPPVVAGLLAGSRLTDPYVRWLLGPLIGPLIEAMDVAVVLNVYAMMVLYIPALIEADLPADRPGRAWRLIAGIVIGWSGTELVFSNLSWVYGTLDRDILRDSPAIPSIRLMYLVLLLTGSSFHIATGICPGDRWWPMAAYWSLWVAAAVLVFTAAGIGGYVPGLEHLLGVPLPPTSGHVALGRLIG
jgi:hypothetical protein